MSQAYLIVNSNDRNKDLYPDPANYKVIGDRFSFAGREISFIKATEFSMNYDIPNICNRNNVMVVDDGATSYPLSVPQGYYDEAALASILQTQLIGAIGGGQSVLWSTVQQRFSIQTTIPIKFTQYPLQKKDLSDVMGFAKNGPLLTSNVSGSSDLVYTRNMYLKSNDLHKYKNINDQSTSQNLIDILMTIPVYQPGADLTKPQTISYEASWPKNISYDNANSITAFDMQLLDDQGETLYNPDGVSNSWNYHLTIVAIRM